MAQIADVVKRLKRMYDKAEIKETVSPGSAIKILPSEKELSQLAHLAGELCKLRR